MKSNVLLAIYIMWLRQIKRFLRRKSRIVGMVVQPLFFLVILGAGLREAILPGMTGGYIVFFAPGIIAMAILFSSVFTGISILWDREYGFLQEVLVAPISRYSIIIGRTLGGSTTALIQGFIILIITIALRVPIQSLTGLLLTVVFMILISFTAVGFGLVIASKMEDFQGFQVIMNLIIMPLFFLSSAFFPIANSGLPDSVVAISFINPLFYMVDGLRGSLTGVNNVLHPLVDLAVVSIFCIIIIAIGSHFFNKSEA